jgi:hypothetical protein
MFIQHDLRRVQLNDVFGVFGGNMGYMRHNAIVVTSWKESAIKKASAMAEKIGLQIISQSEEVVNGYRSLLV